METWNVIEKADYIKTIFKGHEDKLASGKVFTHPETFQPHLFVRIENFCDGQGAIFLVPMELLAQ